MFNLFSEVSSVVLLLPVIWLILVNKDYQNISQPSFVGPFDVVGPMHLPTMSMP